MFLHFNHSILLFVLLHKINVLQVEGGEVTQLQHQTEEQKEREEITQEDDEVKPGVSGLTSDSLSERLKTAGTDDSHSQGTSQQTGSNAEHKPPPKTHSGNSLESVQSITHGEYFENIWRVQQNAPHGSGSV